MADIVDRATRSRMMAGIREKNTRPELRLRRGLHARGFRYRLQVKELRGRPDLVLPKYLAVILVHGCFWHRHQDCKYTTTPGTRPEFWQRKFQANVRRDALVLEELGRAGWRVCVVWECALRGNEHIEKAVEWAAAWLRGSGRFLEIGAGDLRYLQLNPGSAGCPT